MSEQKQENAPSLAHRHRCLRCNHEFDCQMPGVCLAGVDVFPSVIVIGASGPELVEHCERDANGEWKPVHRFDKENAHGH